MLSFPLKSLCYVRWLHIHIIIVQIKIIASGHAEIEEILKCNFIIAIILVVHVCFGIQVIYFHDDTFTQSNKKTKMILILYLHIILILLVWQFYLSKTNWY